MPAKTVPLRRDLPKDFTWDVESIFATDAEWEKAFKQVADALPALQKFQGRLGESPAVLADWFEQSETTLRLLGMVYVYAGLGHEADTGDQAAKAKDDRAGGLWGRTAAALAFAEPETLAIGFDTLRKWAKDEPRLTVFQHYFDTLEQRAEHIRSAEVEEVLGHLADPFATARGIHGTLADADLKFRPAVARDESEDFEVTQGTIGALLVSPDRAVRRSAWENYADAHLAVKNTIAQCLASGVKQHVMQARVRKYPSSLEAAVGANFIPSAVFHNLIATFKRHLPTWHRYWRLRRAALGLDELHVYDIKAPLTSATPEIPYAQSIEWICDGMKPLGDEYVAAMRKGLESQRWVDVYPNQGKRAGAFSSGVPGTHPFILMSYTDDIFSLSTLAHELGHSMHSFLTNQTQPYVYSDYSIFVAEVASNFDQALVRKYLLDTQTDPDFQIAVIEEAMSNFHRYFFIMPILARFELEMHERVERGEALTADSLLTLMSDLFREGYGGEVVIDADRIGITWAEFPTHLYSNFYVYQYATGISAAHALAEPILRGDDAARKRYLEFLSTGSSLYPLDALKRAGVDLTQPEPVDRGFAYLATLVDRLEGLLQARKVAVS